MHPEVRSNKSGKCTKCGMDMKASIQTYSCPNHPDMISANAGSCKIFGETLKLNFSPKEKAKYQSMKLFTCPMHPDEKSNKPGKCKICGMTLKALQKIRIKFLYTI